ncbi:FAD-binding oxidoreductase [Bosea sp. TAF32]|uniref:FAD-binding oxidoreductase n=1 Tax=Bosea sp. TAF32 TaxID=3237482 RepID=UPI003F93A822
MESGLVTDGAIASSGQQAADFWQLRENIPEAEVHHGGSVKHDVAVRTSRLAAFIQAASKIVNENRPGAILSVYGHVGDGNVHFNVVAPQGVSALEFKAGFEEQVSPKIYELAFDMGGTFSAEYGIGRVKLDLLARFGAPSKVDIMRLVKQALDPQKLMNPGKVIPNVD